MEKTMNSSKAFIAAWEKQHAAIEQVCQHETSKPEKINRCRNCISYPASGGGREVCTLLGIMVYASNQRKCFRSRHVQNL